MHFVSPSALSFLPAVVPVNAHDSKHLWISLIVAAIGLIAALLFARGVPGNDSGIAEMQRISRFARAPRLA